jgi:hypothetical protein
MFDSTLIEYRAIRASQVHQARCSTRFLDSGDKGAAWRALRLARAVTAYGPPMKYQRKPRTSAGPIWHLSSVRAGHDSDAPSIYLEDPARAGLRLVETCKTGWYLDSDGSEVVHGVVYQMTAKRGRARYLAGYADPRNYGAALLHLEIYRRDDWTETQRYYGRPSETYRCDGNDAAKRDAIAAADSIAENLAERERERQYAYDSGATFRDARRELLEQGRELLELARELRQAFRARHDAAREARTLDSMSLACFGLDAGALAEAARAQHGRDVDQIRALLARVRSARDAYRDARDDIRRHEHNPDRLYLGNNADSFWEGYRK